MKHIKIIFFLAIFPSILFSQKLTWEVGTDFFFDNTEFAKSSYTIDQTMAGIHLNPEIGVKWDRKYTLYGGVDMLKRLGSNDVADDIHLLAYYQFKDKKTLFRAGLFKKEDLLDDYSNFFFQDSVRYYRSVMEGLFFKKGNKNQFVKLWLDWTGLQSDTVRESFFLGASAYQGFAKHFFADFQSYVFHYARTQPPISDQYVCDNILAQVSVGYKYSYKNWDKIVVSAGILAGFERNRKNMDDYYMPVGFVGKVDAEYKQFGMENLLYAGEQRMKLYNDLGNAFYWGNPFLRGNFYLQNKLYWKVFDTKYVSGQLASRQHFSEGKLYFEQLFTLSASIGK
ncbi:hypothetical protein TRIP_D390016 [uncultured Paludibacter sp.]|nr:hypothetical protein TRIP_D390016 [uncultured Paludibacter sp.]